MPLKVVVCKKGEQHPAPSIAGTYVRASSVAGLVAEREAMIQKWEREYGKPIDKKWVDINCSYNNHILEGDAVMIVWKPWGTENEFGVETP